VLSAGAHGTPSGPPSFTLGLAVCGMCRQVVAAVSHVSGVESVDVPRGHGVSLSPRPPSRVTAHLFARRHSTPTPTPFSRLHGNLLLEWIVTSSFLPAPPPPTTLTGFSVLPVLPRTSVCRMCRGRNNGRKYGHYRMTSTEGGNKT